MRSTRFALAFPLLVVAVGFSGACSDPVPLIPRGAWSLTFQAPSAKCQVQGHNANVGTVGPSGDLELKADGSDKAVVTCEVKPSGGGYSVSGKVRVPGQSLTVDIPLLKKDQSFDDPATGDVDFLTGQTGDLYSGECIFYFVKDQLIDKGKVWASFQCPEVVNGDSVCAVQQGYIAFENCIGTATEEDGEE